MPYGQNGVVSINFQNSFGTEIVTSNYFLPIISESVTLKKDPLVSGEMRGIYDEGATYEGKNSNDGDIEVEPDNTTLGVFCRAAFGPATLTTSDSLQTHVFVPRTADFDTFIAGGPITYLKDLDDAGSAQVFYDMAATAIEFNVANGEFLKTKLNVIGGKYKQTAAVAASYPTDLKWTWNTTSFQLGAAGIDELADLTITVDEALGNKYSLDGTKTPSHTKREGFRTVAVAGTMLFNDQDQYQIFIAQTEQAMELYMTTGTEVQSGYVEAIQIKCPALRYSTFEPSLGGAGQIEVGFDGMAKYHTGSGTAIEVTLVNTHTIY